MGKQIYLYNLPQGCSLRTRTTRSGLRTIAKARNPLYDELLTKNSVATDGEPTEVSASTILLRSSSEI